MSRFVFAAWLRRVLAEDVTWACEWHATFFTKLIRKVWIPRDSKKNIRIQAARTNTSNIVLSSNPCRIPNSRRCRHLLTPVGSHSPGSRKSLDWNWRPPGKSKSGSIPMTLMTSVPEFWIISWSSFKFCVSTLYSRFSHDFQRCWYFLPTSKNRTFGCSIVHVSW